MASPVPQIPLRAPLQSPDGMISNQWANWLVTLYKRIGGGSADTNIELAASQTESLATINAEITALQNLTTIQTAQITSLQSEADGLSLGPLP